MSWLSKAVKKASKAVKKASIKKVAATVKKTAQDVAKAAKSPIGQAVLGVVGTVVTGGLLGPVALTVAQRAAGMAAKLGKVEQSIVAPIKGMVGDVNKVADMIGQKISKNSGAAPEVMVFGAPRQSINPVQVKSIPTPSRGGGSMLLPLGIAAASFFMLKGK